MKLHQGDGTTLDTEFPGDVPATVTYHTPCHLANGVIIEQTGRTSVHPIQMIARAYGIPEEPMR